MNDDVIVACTDLVGRAGAAGFEIGYAGDDDARVIVEDHRSPSAAALALAERLLDGAMCRCTRMVTLSDGRPGCRWRLAGQRWEPGCDAAPVVVAGGQRGDMAAIQRAMAQVPPGGNRAARRAAKRRRR